MDVERPVAAAAHVVLAGPLHLDRRLPADRLGDARPPRRSRRHRRRRAGRSCRPVFITCSLTLSGVDAGDLGGDRLVEIGHLVAAPDLERAVVVHAARPRSAAPARHGRGRGTRTSPRATLRGRRRAPPPRRRRCAPSPRRLPCASSRVFGQELGGAALSRPCASSHSTVTASRPLSAAHMFSADDRDAARSLDHVDHALDRLGRGGVEGLRPWRRTAADGSSRRSACRAA